MLLDPKNYEEKEAELTENELEDVAGGWVYPTAWNTQLPNRRPKPVTSPTQTGRRLERRACSPGARRGTTVRRWLSLGAAK